MLKSAFLSFFILSCFAWSTVVAVYPDPLPGTDIKMGAPTVVYNADLKKYFLFGTEKFIPYYASRSITGPWTNQGVLMPNGTKVGLEGGYWAPDCRRSPSQLYVCYYSISNLGSQTSVIGVTSSPSMLPGTWTDHGRVIRSDPSLDYNAIDPNTLIVDGKLVLQFGSYWQGLYQFQMKNFTTVAPNTKPVKIAVNQGHTEAVGVWKHPQTKWYYMFWSEGRNGFNNGRPPAGQEYRILVGRATSAHGPFKDKAGNNLLVKKPNAIVGTVVLQSHGEIYAPGGQSVFHDAASGNNVLVYHYLFKNDTTNRARVGFNYLNFSSGWPVVVAQPPHA